jgi:hypothetical protein
MGRPKSKFDKIYSHPNKSMIIRMFNRGDGVRKIANTLKEKYPDDKKLHVSTVTLQRFRKEVLKLEKEALEQLKQERKIKKQESYEKKEISKIKRLPVYKDKVKEIINYHVELENEIKELLVLAKARMEDLFDKASTGELTINEEGNLLKYFQTITTTIDKWAKYVEKIADRTVENTTNVNITIVEDQLALMRTAISETIEEMSPDLKIKFLNNLSRKMEQLNYRQNKSPSFDNIKDDVKLLNAEVEDIDCAE